MMFQGCCFAAAYICVTLLLSCSMTTNSLDGVILTVGKDSFLFEKSVKSALKYLIDIDYIYVVSPDASAMERKFSSNLGNRVKFIDESIFPFSIWDVPTIMVEAVKSAGIYKLTGTSEFENFLIGKKGWFFQQLLKFYSGETIKGIGDYVLLDGDLVWFRNVTFINRNSTYQPSYFYASSNQYHADYLRVMSQLTGISSIDKQGVHRSGIVHHMPMSKTVLRSLFRLVVERYVNTTLPPSSSSSSSSSSQILPSLNISSSSILTSSSYTALFWKIALVASARQLTCNAPRTRLCGAGSTLSEYELYYHYARTIFPHTFTLRPLFWANGPKPGMLYWPNKPGVNFNHGDKGSYAGFRTPGVSQEANVSSFEEAFLKQMDMDRLLGYHFIGYHSYAKRRYYELMQSDIDALCPEWLAPGGGPITSNFTSTCSWREYHWSRAADWWKGCLCHCIRKSFK